MTTPSVHYVSHPAVIIDPDTPVPQWSLTTAGREAAAAIAELPWAQRLGRIIASAETKAREAAEILAERTGLTVEVRPDTGETDRSSTGFVPHDRHEELADAFFAAPHVSAEGWERSADAQARIVAALADLLEPTDDHDSVVIGHGAVGTLWYCHLAGLPIDRRYDQPGSGYWYSVDCVSRKPLNHWSPIVTQG